MPIAALTLKPIAQFGRFEILGRLATGGMAEIFLAREHAGRAQRAVVIKRILPHVASDKRFVDMFMHEAELVMTLSHPNLCSIYEFGEHAGEFFIAMEWVHGVSITQMHKAVFERGESGVPAHLVARMASQVASALDHAHRAVDAEGQPLSLVHRDVTPDNVMVGFNGQVKLLDFGVAKAASQRHKTETGLLKGKFAYMSPEQYEGVTLDGRADVFSLGACMYEAITGLALFHRESEYETMASIMSGEPAPRVRAAKPAVSRGLDDVVAKALAKRRDQRFASAGVMHEAIEHFLVDAGIVVGPQDLAEFVGDLYPQERDDGPQVEHRPEVWTRESNDSRERREALTGIFAEEADAQTVEIAETHQKKGRLVGLAVTAVVLALVAVVVRQLLAVP